MNEHLKKRLMRTMMLAGIALLIGIGIGFYQVSQDVAQVKNISAKVTNTPMDVAGVQIGGAFTLTDHNGNTVTDKAYSGQYKLIYFGFTYCPAICPTELQKISQVLRDLGEQAEQIQPLFITVDPERDTPEVMREYVKLFHPKIIGLSGEPEQIAPVLKNYKIYANKVEDEDMSDYTMDHSSLIYLMDEDNNLKSVYRIEDDAAFILKDIKSHLGNA